MVETEMHPVHNDEHNLVIAEIREHLQKIVRLTIRFNWRGALQAVQDVVLLTRAFSINCRDMHHNRYRLAIEEYRVAFVNDHVAHAFPEYSEGYIGAFQGFATEMYALGAIMGVLPNETFAMYKPFRTEAIRPYSRFSILRL